jgi:hypothetical protein
MTDAPPAAPPTAQTAPLGQAPRLVGEFLVSRPLTVDDAEITYAWRNGPGRDC